VTTTSFSLSTAAGAAAVGIDGLGVAFGTRAVLRDVDLTVAPGQRVGLVGENGSGKSTLLRVLAGAAPSRAVLTGAIRMPEDRRFLAQQPPYADSDTVTDVRAGWVAGSRRLEAELERLAARIEEPAAARAYGDLMDLAVQRDVWGAGPRAEQAAARLGVDSLDGDVRIGALSGGQRARLAMVGLIADRPWTLLLDEPTNHLDDDAIEVLTDVLRTHAGPVLLASHDRVLLDDACTHLYDLDPAALGTDGRGGRLFGGTWSEYEDSREAARRRWEETWRSQQDELARLRTAGQVGERDVAAGRGPRDNDKFIHAFKGANVQRTVARRRRDASRRLEIAEREQVAKPRPRLRFAAELTSTGESGTAVRVRRLAVDGRLALARLDVAAGEQLLVTGANGSGKSTLLGVLAARVAHRGEVDVRGSVALLAQDVDLADPASSALELYERHRGPDAPELRALGLVHPRDLPRPVGLLSVGQQRRVALALAIAASPQVLLLDEPTNHLSLALVAELEEALAGTPGTVVVASHDRWLRRRWDGPELALGGAER
jgi:macrolide transport system ATP-binding/permease protein